MKPHRKPIANAAAIALMTLRTPKPMQHHHAQFTGTLDRPADQPAANDPPAWDVANQLAAMAPKTAEPESKEEPEKAADVEALSPQSASDDADEQGQDSTTRNRRLAVEVGARIRCAREANGISQGELAKAMGHEKQTQQSLWEAGKRMVPMSELPGLAKALDTSTDYLLGLSNDMDANPAETRRGLLVQHLRDQLEAVAGSLADVALESGLELEGSIRNSKLLTRCEAVRVALDRFRAANEAQFDDLRGGAWLDRTTRELMEAAMAVGAELDGVGQRRERAARKAKAAMAAGAL